MILRVTAFLLFLLALPSAYAYDSPAIPGFIDEMVARHNFRRNELVELFGLAKYQQKVIDAITSPATLKPWPEYRSNFINPARIKAGVRFWKRNAATVLRAEKKFGVPQEIIVALLGVETFYGQQAGNIRTIDALSTLAFNYPPRADYFRRELEQYLILARDQSFNLLGVRGSYAGALGIAQFMPSSYRKYAVDFNGNGKIDLIHEKADAIGSAANYLKQYGWVRGEPMALRSSVGKDCCAGNNDDPHSVADWAAMGVKPVAHRVVPGGMRAKLLDFTMPDGKEYWLAFPNFDVVMTYNNSDFYAMSVLQLAEALRHGYYGH
jgi:membrane-bound lytic murein transglycosylase B